MSEASDAAPLVAAKVLRDAAHGVVKDDIRLLKDGLAERPIPQRVKAAATNKLVDTADTAREVAAENKLVIAGTLAALAAWILRGPIRQGIEAGWEKLKELGDR